MEAKDPKEQVKTEVPKVVEAKTPILPRAMGDRRPPVEETIKLTVDTRKDAIFFMLYLMLKSHIISRMNLKQILNIINDESPKDIPLWLVKEAAKA